MTVGSGSRIDSWVLRQGKRVAPATGGAVALIAWLGYPLLACVIHGLGALVTWRFWRLTEAEGSLVSLNAATLSLAFPVIGPALAWAVLSRQQDAQGAITELYRNYIELRYQQPLWARPIRDQSQAAQRAASVRPLVDQLRFGDLGAKLQAAEALTRLPEFSGLPVLRDALVHPSEDTRLMASLALIKVEQRLTEQVDLAERRLALAQQDPEATMGLAEALHDLVQSGTATRQVAEPIWQRIAELLAALHRQSSQLSPNGWLLWARARASITGLNDGLSVLDEACTLYTDAPALWAQRCEWLYDRRAFDDLRALAPHWLAVALPGSPDASVAQFWASGSGREN